MENTHRIIELPGQPIPAARPRVTRFGNTFDPKAKEKKIAKVIVAQQWPREPLNCPVSLDVIFHMPIPASWSGKKKIAHKDKPHQIKPDIDNLLKFVMDSMNGVIFQDDSCIYGVHALKVYGEEAKTIIKVNGDNQIEW